MSLLDGSIATTIAGEELILLPARAAFWPARSTVIIADLHVGKTSTFRSKGVALPRGTTAADLTRLGRVIVETGARRLVIAGDLFHAEEGTMGEPLRELLEWRDTHPGMEIVLTTGNHDRSSGDIPDALGLQVIDAYRDGPFEFRHLPVAQDGRFVIAGHLHPVARLQSRSREGLRLPCFHFGLSVGVLPAFSLFTGGWPIQPNEGDKVFVVAGQEVVNL